MGGKPENHVEEPKNPRLDLSVAQVAGSAVAAVVAAVLASQLGVYGTIIGAGVVSVVATSGGTVFQHLFRRTGEQLREVTVHAKPKARQVPVHEPRGYGQEGREDGDATRTRVLRTVMVPTDLSNAGLPDEEFSEATTHGTRVRGWKRSVVAAVVVFVVAMGGITAYELITGDGLGGGKGSTVGTVFRGGEQHQRQKETPPSQAPGETPGSGSTTPGTGTGGGQSPGQDSGTGTGEGGASPDPSSTPPTTTDGGSTGETGEATPTPTPTPTPSGTTGGEGGDTGADADEDPATGGDGDNGSSSDNGEQAGTPAP
ncbi:hypothetical protein ACWDZ4_30870 [Streptomyces sp. NPDC003016]